MSELLKQVAMDGCESPCRPKACYPVRDYRRAPDRASGCRRTAIPIRAFAYRMNVPRMSQVAETFWATCGLQAAL